MRYTNLWQNCMTFTVSPCYVTLSPLPSNKQHLSNDACRKAKRENCQNSSVLYCVWDGRFSETRHCGTGKCPPLRFLLSFDVPSCNFNPPVIRKAVDRNCAQWCPQHVWAVLQFDCWLRFRFVCCLFGFSISRVFFCAGLVVLFLLACVVLWFQSLQHRTLSRENDRKEHLAQRPVTCRAGISSSARSRDPVNCRMHNSAHYKLGDESTTDRRLCVIQPSGLMRTNAFFVVAVWKCADLALAKNVSGHQILSSISLLMHSSSSPVSLKLSRESCQCWRK